MSPPYASPPKKTASNWVSDLLFLILNYGIGKHDIETISSKAIYIDIWYIPMVTNVSMLIMYASM